MRPRFVVGALVAVALHPGPAAGSRLPFRHYLTADGLPQSQVLAVHQDRRGEIWVGTWCGAARFDGADFRILTQRGGLPSNYVRDIVEDGAGDLWLAVGNGVARIVPGERGRVGAVYDPLIPRPVDSPVRDLHVDRAGRVWAATKGDGAAYFEGGAVHPVAAPEIATDGLQLLGETASGELLLGTEAGVYVLEPGGSRPWRDGPGPWTEPVRMLQGTADGFVFATETATWRLAGETASELRSADGGPLAGASAAHVDRHGTLWVATDHGLYRQTVRGFVRLGVESGLLHEKVYALHEDREGNLWLGTDGGLSRLGDESIVVLDRRDGLPPEGIWGLAVDPEGELWVAAHHGVARRRGDGFETVPLPPEVAATALRSVAVDHRGGLWLGTRDDGLYHRRADGRWRHLRPPEIASDRVFWARCDADGVLWFGGRRGLTRISGDDIRSWTRADGLPNDTVWMVGRDAAGRLLAATDAGLVALQGDRFVVAPGLERFAGVTVRSFVVDRAGALWVGTNGQGLHRHFRGRWTAFFAGDGPSDDFVWGLEVDDVGRLWVATNHGFDVFDGERWVRYGQRDGLPSDEIAVNAVLRDGRGALWLGFGGLEGLARIAPDRTTAPTLPPLVRVAAATTAQAVYEEPTHLRLPWRERDVTFAAIGISFRDERRVAYRTMLEGYDEAFSAPTPERRVRYTNLAPGRYRFLALASSADGVWSPAPAAVTVEILAPFWRTPLFEAFLAVAGLAAVALVHGWRTRRLRREKDSLEALVQDRTRSLEEQVAVRERLQREYERLAITDALTEVHNRRYFDTRLRQEIERVRGEGGALGFLLLDLDEFKAINDRHGHQVGDAVLREVGRALCEGVRGSDLVARYGGEEFVVAFLGAGREACRRRAEGLRAGLEARVLVPGRDDLRVTFSGGLVWHDFGADGSPGFDEIVRRADEALYRAKREGRNRIVSAGEPVAAPARRGPVRLGAAGSARRS